MGARSDPEAFLPYLLGLSMLKGLSLVLGLANKFDDIIQQRHYYTLTNLMINHKSYSLNFILNPGFWGFGVLGFWV